ncbi:MAG: oxidoreductase [Spirochaetia bacterium]|jgi:uncharacterized oxidoreductase|nr:oxidoreductase [Spirochaetia bacterium]
MEYPSIRIQPGPDNCFSYAGSLEKLNTFFTEEELKNSLWLHGEKAGKAAAPYLPEAYTAEGTRSHVIKGHCTHEAVNALAEEATTAPAIIGIGGGTVLDTAKALSEKAHKPFVAIPTIAATCAAWTPLSVWYSMEGKALGYEIFSKAAFLLLIEPRIILDAPQMYLQAGVADTIAKWYEADILTKGLENLPLTVELGLRTAKMIGEVLLDEGPQAFAAMKAKELTPTFIKVVDAVIAGGGLVGGLGERFTRVAAAHALHNGMSVLQETHDRLHGLKVAYGTLVQAALLGDDAELKKLYDKFKVMGLPTKFADLGVDATDTKKIDAVIEATLVPHESIHLLPFPVDDKLVRTAIAKVESLV